MTWVDSIYISCFVMSRTAYSRQPSKAFIPMVKRCVFHASVTHHSTSINSSHNSSSSGSPSTVPALKKNQQISSTQGSSNSPLTPPRLVPTLELLTDTSLLTHQLQNISKNSQPRPTSPERKQTRYPRTPHVPNITAANVSYI